MVLEALLEPANLDQRFASLEASLTGRLEMARLQLRDLVMTALRREVPVRTGALQSSLHWVPSGAVDILWGVSYGKHVICGTRPHEITPQAAQALAFDAGDGLAFARRVQHPGTKPNDFRQAALDNVNIDPVLQQLEDWVRRQVSAA